MHILGEKVFLKLKNPKTFSSFWAKKPKKTQKKQVFSNPDIRERSLSVINLFLDEMAKEAKNIITTICDEQCTLSDRSAAQPKSQGSAPFVTRNGVLCELYLSRYFRTGYGEENQFLELSRNQVPMGSNRQCPIKC